MRNPDAVECLELMLPLCESVSDRIKRYGITAENIATNNDYLDLVLMPIFQIGELIGGQHSHGASVPHGDDRTWRRWLLEACE